ncbi:MAG: 1-deoxy-D-xylulose-5-phosphate synthase [Propionibacteriaceae bacterium]|jgi:1-deoxy-D-xylulose-5-phosphate synthase|nr:1-deoxy-D-xylulose-5-phosphate synthase [Propionibacteriaceae bacterium]
MPWLNEIETPEDIRHLTPDELKELAQEIRDFLIEQVSATGGHLGPNLGVVELTLALHRVFDSPADPIVFDTGHQAYVHKLLTGRRAAFPTLRQAGGLSGYPSRSESGHDWVENSHASAALSWAAGLAEGLHLRGDDHTVVAVVGDGALTGGMAWEALNNIAVQETLRLVIVVNDNGRSYAPTHGGLAAHLAGLRTDERYEPMLDFIKHTVQATPLVGRPAYDLLHGLKTGLKDILAPQGLFSDLGIKYLGPIDGHDLADLERVLAAAKGFRGPVIVHAITEKGRGFAAAENHAADHFHAVGHIDATTGEPLDQDGGTPWTEVFAAEAEAIGREFSDVVALSAAMVEPVGLGPFARAFPERVFDVGIAEQHAVASAAGLASAGYHPIVAVYATFLNRAFDQVLLDAGLHSLGVTFVLDRAGITGPDGPSHHGIWDMALFGLVPGLALAAPRDAATLRRALRQAIAIDDHPTVVRYPKGAVPPDLPAVAAVGGVDLLAGGDAPAEVLLIGYGPLARLAVEAAEALTAVGRTVTVADPVWALPVNPALIDLARPARVVVTLEDGVGHGGVGQQVAATLEQAGVAAAIRPFALPTDFIAQGTRGEILRDAGFTVDRIVAVVTAALADQG